MTEKKISPYGSWKSPITSDLIVSGTIRLGQIITDGLDVFWDEMRPSENGRNTLVHWSADGGIKDVSPAGFNVRTRVHEYGGGSVTVHKGDIYYSNFVDQRLYRQYPLIEAEAMTPAGDFRYADGVVDEARNRLICVREDHSVSGEEATNTIVSLELDGHDQAGQILVSGNDFYSNPRLSPDGKKLAWLTWNHPNMPWNGTDLWVADLNEKGEVSKTLKIAGSHEESIFQPEWSPENVLHFVSDRTGWWNLYRQYKNQIEPLCPMEAEFGRPQWVFGMTTYGFESADSIICCYTQDGFWHLARLNISSGELTPIKIPYTSIGMIKVAAGHAVFTAGSAVEPTLVVRLNLATEEIQVLRRASTLSVDQGYLTRPEAIEFPTGNDLTAHAFYYRPQNQEYVGPAEERPPLIVLSHGGPTGSTSASLNYGIQYWTSRGIAVVDVNYGGSTGYGREYQKRLEGEWGIVDVMDCINAAHHLVDVGEVDGNRLAIRGGSAGGYTTLCAIAFHDVFSAGASHFGVSDLEALAVETHKFESRYLDRLVGPYPERRDLYVARSPINFVNQFNCPLILFQGLEDKVVPPNQAEMMFKAVREKGLPVAYVPFEGEQHGFRQAANIKRALDGELYFYSSMFSFELAALVEPVPIENLPT